jgi:hypothetical protein
MYNASTNEINFNYRRNNGGAVFYNVTNTANGQKMTAIRYVSNGALASDAARSVLVGAYKPTLQSSSGAALSGVEVSIRRDSDGVIEASGVTGIDGRITIVAGSTALREQSYNNTFTVGGISYQKIIREAGVKYIKQSVTPATTGGNVVSVDQGTFTVIQRRADLLELKATQSFLADYEGAKTVFADTLFTGTVAQAAAISGIAFVVASGAVTVTVSSSVTGQDVYNLWKHWTSQSAQMAVDQALITIVSGVLMIAGGMTTSAVVAAGGNIKGLQATGTLATIAGGSYTLPISDSNGNSNLVFADVDSWTVYYDAARASQVGAGGLGQNFRFNYTSGTTYYLSLVVSGETFLKEVTPTSAGNTTVSLSSVALLSAIGAKVSALGTPAQAAALEALGIVNHSEHDTTRAAIAAIPVAPSAAAIRTELEAVGSKLDSANKAAKAAKRQTL